MTPDSLAPLTALLTDLDTRGILAVSEGPLGPAAALDDLVAESGLTRVEVDGRISLVKPFGAARALGGSFLDGPDEEFCADPVGEGPGAVTAWEEVLDHWAGETPEPGTDEPWRRREAVLAAILAEVGAVEGRLAVVRHAGALADGDVRALRLLLMGSAAGAGWAVLLEGPLEGAAAAMAEAVQRVQGDERHPVAAFCELPGGGPAESPTLPKKGSAVELLDVLAASPVPLPAAVVGSAALAAYRGGAPRAGWLDLQSVLESGRVSLSHGWLACADRRDDLVAEADCRALAAAIDECLPDNAARRRLAALLSQDRSADAAAEALELGDAAAARLLLGPGESEPLLRGRAMRLSGLGGEARRILKDAVTARPGPELHLEFGLALLESGKVRAARKQLRLAMEGAGSEDQDILAQAALALGRLQLDAGDAVGAAKTLGTAVQGAEREGDAAGSARARALRAVCMARAGVADRAMQELKTAMERAGDADEPTPAAVEARMYMGLVFREAGSRDKARQALGLAAKVAGANAAPVQEAEARLHLARFYIEALPTQGKERGEALRAAREAADQALGLARALGRDDLEAGAEEVLGELSWRAEDWDEALASLERQQGAWRRAGRASKEVDAAIRSSRLAARREQWDEAFASANSALMQATRKRLPEQTAQGQMARAEALAGMGRKDEALAALTEAQRIFGSLGEEFAAQGRAAEQRARRLIAGD